MHYIYNLSVMNIGGMPHGYTYYRNGVRTIIDISFCSPSLAERVKDWHVTHEINSSDHRSIQFFVEIDATYSVYRRNFKKCALVYYNSHVA